MAKTVPERKARQGNWGGQVLLVLVAGLILAFVVWGGVELYGEMIDSGTPGADQTQKKPTG